MRQFLLLIWLMTSVLGMAQKKNYNSFITYGDEYLDQIIKYDLYVSSRAKLLFFGNVKSVYIEERDPTGQVIDVPTQTFFDKDRSTIKEIRTYPRNNTKGIIEYYFNSRFNGYQIFKSSYIENNGQIDQIFQSKIDEKNKLIVQERYSNGKLEEIDSIYYQDNYFPVKIIKKSPGSTNRSTTEIAYNKFGKIYKEIHLKNSNTTGTYFNYDELGRLTYLYTITADEYDQIGENDENDSKNKVHKIKWINDKDFIYYYDSEITFQFDANKKTLIRKDQSSILEADFNEQLLLTKYHLKDDKYSINKTSIFDYNNNLDIIAQKVKSEGLPLTTTTYTYTYDDQQNWIERQAYENGELKVTTIRRIEYQ